MTSDPKTTRRLRTVSTALLLVDIQERLLPAISNHQLVLENAVKLAKGAAILRVPTLVTEQYRKGLGPTVESLAQVLPEFKPLEKLAFSACGAEGLLPELQTRRVTDVVLCGIEAHVCVTQSALDLLDHGYRVFVVTDAVGSRTPENPAAGLDRMRSAGAVPVTTEMVLFELLAEAGTERFKQILALLK